MNLGGKLSLNMLQYLKETGGSEVTKLLVF